MRCKRCHRYTPGYYCSHCSRAKPGGAKPLDVALKKLEQQLTGENKMRNVTSKDPLKPAIVAALKAVSGGNKVTMLREDATHFIGECMKYVGGKYEKLGTFKVNKGDFNATKSE